MCDPERGRAFGSVKLISSPKKKHPNELSDSMRGTDENLNFAIASNSIIHSPRPRQLIERGKKKGGGVCWGGCMVVANV